MYSQWLCMFEIFKIVFYLLSKTLAEYFLSVNLKYASPEFRVQNSKDCQYLYTIYHDAFQKLYKLKHPYSYYKLFVLIYPSRLQNVRELIPSANSNH